MIHNLEVNALFSLSEKWSEVVKGKRHNEKFSIPQVMMLISTPSQISIMMSDFYGW